MKSLEEIEAKVKEIWPDAESISVKEHSEEIIHITIAAMYEAPGRSLKQLLVLSNYLGTQDIEDIEEFGYPGCESCDYGSKYGVTLEVKLPSEERGNENERGNRTGTSETTERPEISG
jgi:hypothetical protein